jgi:hypothetical protein
MLNEITKSEEVIFAELTKNTIIICDYLGWRSMKKIFGSFQKSQEGHSDYLYGFSNGRDEAIFEKVSEKEFVVTFGKSQTVRVFFFNKNSDKIRLEQLKYFRRGIWIATGKEVIALTEYDCDYIRTWKSFLKGFLSGRFQFRFTLKCCRKHFWKVVHL